MRFTSKNLNGVILSILMLLCGIFRAEAATDPPLTMPLKGSLNQIKKNTVSTLTDTKYFSLSTANRDSVKNNRIVNMVGVGIDELSTQFITSNFTVKVTLQITSYNKNPTSTGTTTKIFTINYDTATGAKFKSFEDTVFLNAFKVEAKITNIDSGGINWPVSKVLRVENQMIATRDYNFNCNLAMPELTTTLVAANGELKVSWRTYGIDTLPGVTEYDVEWAWVDDAAILNYMVFFPVRYSQNLIFDNNASRVSIDASNYAIPILYDDAGKIFVRVRPVQVRTDGQRIEGKWTWIKNDATQAVLSPAAVFFSYGGHENDLNWQASTSFAEGGKRKSVVQYFDGSLRNRQTVTKDNTSNTTVVAESFYDYQGRPVIQVLPAPSLNTAIGYAHNFNQAPGEGEYPKWVYDKLLSGSSVCGNSAKPFNTDFGTAKYYSAKNTLTDTKSKFIPDATGTNPNEGYAFTETRIGPDGRVAAQSGVGVTQQLGSSHETKYYYETPAQEELDALFGTDAGEASHYFKNIVKDANGQYSVSYADMHGRTVATALAGESPSQLSALESNSSSSITRQLIDKETNIVTGNDITSSKPIVVLKDNTLYSFDYSLSPKQLNLLSCTNQQVCYDCLYKLKFTISSDCSNEIIYADSSFNFTLGQYINQCNTGGNASQGFIKHFEKYLNQGSYTITKTLSLSREAQEAYRDIFLQKDSCKKFIDFYTQELSVLQSSSNCVVTCASCLAAIGGSYTGFRTKFSQQSGITLPLSAEMEAQLVASYNEVYANCQRMCNNNDGLDVVRSIRSMMLQDMTPPYGQYARLNNNSQTPPRLYENDNYNIFKINDPTNGMEGYGGSPFTIDYKTPIQFSAGDQIMTGTGYLNEFGQAENSTGSLSPTEFSNAFKPSWAEQLLLHHPEFKKLQLSQGALKPAYAFEALIEQDSTWAQAKAHDYISNLVNLDPFFLSVGGSYKPLMIYGNHNDPRYPPAPSNNFNTNPIIYGINNFVIPHTKNPCANSPSYASSFVSMWQVALGAVFCRDKSNGDPCTISYDLATKGGCTMNTAYANPGNNFSEGCDTDRDWAWKTFKTLYLGERRKLIAAYLNANSYGIPGNNGLPPYQERFMNHANTSAVFSNLGAGDISAIITELGNDISSSGQGQAHNLEAAQYDSVCLGYAAAWISELLSCPQINAIYEASLIPPVLNGPDPTLARLKWIEDSTWLVLRLRGICRNGADPDHFLGSASVKPGHPFTLVVGGITYNYTEFPEVIKEFLQYRLSPGIVQPFTADCFSWMITVPKPYERQPVIANSYVLAKPSDCECARINQVKFEYEGSGFAGTFSAYMQYAHGTYISQEQLDALTSLCHVPTSIYACKMLVRPIALPPALQCRGVGNPAPATCISCQEYNNLKSNYLMITGQAAPFAIPQTQEEVDYNQQFASYMNYRTGFRKTWVEYLAFQNTCANANPVISCESLNSTLNAFYLTPEYLQNPYGISCVQAFLNYFNTHYNVVYSYARWMELFAACGSNPNVCKAKITCSSFNALVEGFYNQNGVQAYKNGNCQALFVSYINGQLNSNYTYSELETVYSYLCNGGCGLNICSYNNHFLLTRVYNQFKADYPQPWASSNCQQLFADYFNNYFGLDPAVDWADIDMFYHSFNDISCVPEINDLCSPPYTCEDLEKIIAEFIALHDPVSELPDCQHEFELYFNERLGTDYTYAQIAAIYLRLCGNPLVVCSVIADCDAMIKLWDEYLASFIHEGYPTDYDCATFEQGFVDFFNARFGTSYTIFTELEKLYAECGFVLDNPCGEGVITDPVFDATSLENFLNDFNTNYPDPATQLGGNCQAVFSSQFNATFNTALTYNQIAVYYQSVMSLTLDVCNNTCGRIDSLIQDFNSRYFGLKLPKGAKEDLFTFEYNKAFVQANSPAAGGYVNDGNGSMAAVELPPDTDPNVFNPTVSFLQIQEVADSCGISLNLAPAAMISMYDPQVLNSLKQVYYIIHPNGFPEACQGDFQSWFNVNMQTQYEYSEIMGMYNTVCGNGAGIICSPLGPISVDPTVEEEDGPVVYVNIPGVPSGSYGASLAPLLCGLNDPSGLPVVYDDDPCKDLPKIAYHVAMEKYELYIDSLRNVFDTMYYNKCMAAKDLESFTVTYQTSIYHYTLYYYDQAGNLVKTVPPAGVNRLIGTDLTTVKTFRNNVQNGQAEASNIKVPIHSLVTEYRYNTLNQVVAQQTPDAGVSKFYYDRLGRLVVSQNAKQQPNNHYSYTLYDALGRITEVGQLTNGTAMAQTVSRNETSLSSWLSSKPASQITRTNYDISYLGGGGTLCPEYLCQKNLRNRVSYTGIYSSGTPGSTDANEVSTYYSYDIHGNVDTLLQDLYVEGFGYNTVNSVKVATGNRFKKLVYDYDLVSGKVNAVNYQPDYYNTATSTWVRPADQFHHRYSYDAENRLTLVETSLDKFVWERDARYEYYKHGPLARTILGELQVQGVDYAYTLQGWLKGVNSTAVGDGSFDMGGDGKIGAVNGNVARDVYGYGLNYFGGDYKAIGGTTFNRFVNNTYGLTNTDGATIGSGLYNGNIASMLVNIPKVGGANLYGYKYDQLNRLVSMDAFTGIVNTTNLFTPVATTSYKERISYDANGNIKTYVRNGNSVRVSMDSMAYSYKPGTNQLDKVLDAATDAAAIDYDKYNDIKQGQANGNYEFDAIGNLISDASEGITNIVWNVYGKIQSITKASGTISYGYDASGNRISKTAAGKTTWYLRDASGNVMAVYEKVASVNSGHLTAKELHMYGSSRLGVYNVNNDMQIVNVAGVNIFTRGNKFFELSNHLGNVLATISDKRIAVPKVAPNQAQIDYYIADVVTANDYYPFGMGMPGRKYTQPNSIYRYGFNGMEDSREVVSDAYDFGARIYDSRTSRWYSLDPLQKKYPGESPYLFAGANPIYFIDVDGKDRIQNNIYVDQNGNYIKRVEVTKYNSWDIVSKKRESTSSIMGGGSSPVVKYDWFDVGYDVIHVLDANGKEVSQTRGKVYAYGQVISTTNGENVFGDGTWYAGTKIAAIRGIFGRGYGGIALYAKNGQGEETRIGKFDDLTMADVFGILTATSTGKELGPWEIVSEKIYHHNQEKLENEKRKSEGGKAVSATCSLPGCQGDTFALDKVKEHTGEIDTIYQKEEGGPNKNKEKLIKPEKSNEKKQ